MDKEKRNRYLLITVVVLMLLIVAFISIMLSLNSKNNESVVKIRFNQTYSSDYKLKPLGDNYYLGLYDDGIHAIVDSEGKEIYKTDIGIFNASWYKTLDNKYLIYTNNDNKLKLYIFDGNSFESIRSYDTTDTVKPVLYNDGNNEYIIALVSDNSIYHINDDKIIDLENEYLVCDYIKDNIYYTYNSNSLIVMKDSLMGAIDLDGNILIDFKYNNLINTYNDTLVALNKKNLYGVIDYNDNIVFKFNYEVIDSYKNYYLVVNYKNKMALFDTEFNNITGFEMNYNTLDLYNLRGSNNSIKFIDLKDNIIIINNNLEDMNKTEFDYHNMYIINNGKIIDNINEIGFNFENVYYSYDDNYNINIYNEYMILIGKFKIDNVNRIIDIKYVDDENIAVSYLDNDGQNIIKYFNKKFEEIDFNLGELVYSTNNYYVYLKKDDEGSYLTIKDNKKNEIIKKDGSNIIVNNNTIVIDSDIYNIKES